MTNSKEIKTNSLIALCEIKNYNEFCHDLEDLVKSKKNLIYKIYDMMQYDSFFGKKKYKNFLIKYQDTIEIMKKYDCLCNMIIFKYNSYGEPNEKSYENYFYNYISMHKENIGAIKRLALKIKKLGFDTIIYNEEKKEYDSYIFKNDLYGEFKYFENIKILPTYNQDIIKYKTDNSCYCMTFKINNFDETISKNNRIIELNSLTFNPNKLPNMITNESTIENIKKLANENKDSITFNNLINMSISTDDLISQYEYTKKLFEAMENTSNKEKLNKILNSLSIKLKNLKLISKQIEDDIITNNEFDEQKIEKGKRLRLAERNF